ncbi:MAG: fructose-bisphosphatase class II, partial [Candidatus Omnitrophota bacterium]|nr:fructose-bisphosphatase class II [Candidatus Omnitrophota bacterium]
PKERKEEFKLQPLDPDISPQAPYQQIKDTLNRIAQVNGITIADLEVVLMDRRRETARLKALERLQAENKGLVITPIRDGTVCHGLLATFGRKEGKHKVLWTVGGSPEAFMNLAVARVFEQEGAVAGVRIYSKRVNDSQEGKGKAVDLSWRYNFSEDEKELLRHLRPQDAEQIIRGERLFTLADVQGPTEAALAFITDNGVFNQPGVEDLGEGKYRVHLLRVKEINRGAYVWVKEEVRPAKSDTYSPLGSLSSSSPILSHFQPHAPPSSSPVRNTTAQKNRIEISNGASPLIEKDKQPALKKIRTIIRRGKRSLKRNFQIGGFSWKKTLALIIGVC